MKSEYIPQYFSAYHSERISYSHSGRFEAQALSYIQVCVRRNARGCMFFAPPSSPQLSQEAKKDNTLTLWLKERDKSLWANTFFLYYAHLLQYSFITWNHVRKILCFLPPSRQQHILEI